MKKLLTLSVLTCLFAGLAIAASGDEKKAIKKDAAASEAQTPARPQTPGPRGSGAGMDRREMVQQMIEQRAQQFKVQMDELEAIKKLAEEENAPRTAEALQKLIDKKTEEFKQMQTQMQQRMQNRPAARPGRPEPRSSSKPAVEEESKETPKDE